MTRVVIDTNIYISALVFGGVAQKVFDLINSQHMRLCISQPIMNEVAEVLSEKFDWSRRDVERFLTPLWENSIYIMPRVRVEVCVDPDDDRILECAQTAHADFIVTGDDDLLRLKRYDAATIITPRAFLEAHEPL